MNHLPVLPYLLFSNIMGKHGYFPFIADRELINQQLDNFYTFLQSTTLRAGKVPVRAIAPSLPPAQSLILQSNQHGKPPAIGNENHPLK